MDTDEIVDLWEMHFGVGEPKVELSSVIGELACLKCDAKIKEHEFSFVCPFCGSSNFWRNPDSHHEGPGCIDLEARGLNHQGREQAHHASDRYRKTSSGRGQHKRIIRNRKAA